MSVIEQVRELEKALDLHLDEHDDKDENALDEKIEHMAELFNYISDWEAVWTNSGYDNQE